MSEPAPKPVKGDNETSLDFGLRQAKWKRAERARQRKAREMVESPPAEAAEPEDSVESDVRDAWTRSERELEKMGE